MKKALLGMVACTLLLAACTKDDNSDNDTGTGPINNSTWIYHVAQLNEAGDTTISYNTTLKATAVTLNGSSWLRLTEQPSGQPVLAMQKRADGWWYMDLQGSNTDASLWYKTPASEGDSYPYLYGTCNVTEVNASATVPAGTYNDVTHVKGYDGNSLEDEFWFTNTGAVLLKYDTYDAKSGQPESDVYKKESWVLMHFDR